MKHLKIFAVLVFLLSAPMSFADGNGNSSGNSNGNGGEETPIKIHPSNPTAPRPKDTTAAEDNVSCIYSNGRLTFEFAEPEGRATLAVTRLEDGAVATASFMTWSPYTFTVGTEPGTYQISLSTSRDKYYGIFSID